MTVACPVSVVQRGPQAILPNNTFDENKMQRVSGNSFTGAYSHKNARLNNTKTKASHHNPYGFQFPTFRGSEIKDVDDGSTGKLEGFLMKTCLYFYQGLRTTNSRHINRYGQQDKLWQVLHHTSPYPPQC